MTRNLEGRMLRALCLSAARSDVTIALRASAERPWSSATFSGGRWTMTLEVAGANGAAWLAILPEEDLPVPGHLVADLIVATTGDGMATVEMLLLEA